MSKILVVDDEANVRRSFAALLEDEGFSVAGASDGLEALRIIEREKPDTVLLDLRMPGMDGISTLKQLRKLDPHVPIIIITGHGDITSAVSAIKEGAYDYVEKPPDIERLCVTLRRAVEQYELQKEITRLNTALEISLEDFFGKSDAIKKIISQINLVSRSDFSVIIHGETGTGKTTAAQAIHRLSRRAEGPFVVVDMGAIAESLAESELFGHEKGAFTGAEKKKKGYFESANRGTILIDELQNMSPYVQTRLLRVVEEKKLYPLGSTNPSDIDVRIIAATNTDIHEAVKEKKFREDLFFRLSEYIIHLPPLRERPEDIPFLAQRFLLKACLELNNPPAAFSGEALLLLTGHPWPGNVRELKNAVKRALLLADCDMLRPEHFGFLNSGLQGAKCGLPVRPLKEVSAQAVRDVERDAIVTALACTGGNKTKAAAMLLIDYKTLLTKIKDYEI